MLCESAQNAITKYHWVAERTEICFSWFWKLEIPDGVLQSLVSGGSSPPDMPPSHCSPHMDFPLSARRGNLCDWIMGELTRLCALLRVVTPGRVWERGLLWHFKGVLT